MLQSYTLQYYYLGQVYTCCIFLAYDFDKKIDIAFYFLLHQLIA